MILFLVLTSVTFSLFGFIIGIWADGFEKLQLVPLLIVTPLTFLGGSFYSIDMLPPVWQTVTLFNPVVYLISGFRWSFYGIADVSVAVSLGMTIVFLALFLAIVRLDLQDRLSAEDVAPERARRAALPSRGGGPDDFRQDRPCDPGGEVPHDVLAAAAGQAVPQGFVVVQADDRVGERHGRIGNQHVAPGLEMHPFNGERSRHHGKPGGLRGTNLSLYARAIAQRRDRQTAALQVRLQVGHMTERLDAAARNAAQRLGHVGADQVGARLGQSSANLRPHLGDVPLDRVDIRPVLEPPDEEHTASLAEWRSRRVERDHVRDDANVCSRERAREGRPARAR